MQAPSASPIPASERESHFEVLAIDMPDVVSRPMRTAKSLARRLEASVRQGTTDPDVSRLHGPEYLIRRLALVAASLVALAPGAVGAEGESMLYLVEFEATEAGAPTTRDEAIELREEFIIPSLERLEGDDKIRGGGLFVLARAGVFVVGPQTHDEVTELVRAIPAWAAWGRSVAPLERFANRAELEKKIVRGLRSQGKMMDNRRRLCRTRQASQF